jgi:hypothetical protein|tara:strand:- start:292 stop:624 length:333 start_codon:yes stop_codon:yes gene_type:complete
MYKLDNNDAMINGTSLQGHIEATYDDLVKAYGEPAFDSTRDGESDKVHTEWALEFQNEEGDYITATIYDWKEDSAYNSRVGKYRWHIGGNSYEAVEAVYDYANLKEVADA